MKYFALIFAFLLPLVFTGPSQQAAIPLCTAAQHAAYVIKGPDGAVYSRWHPQVDQRVHCAYGHEHGSDPGLILPSFGFPYEVSAADVPFGYVGTKHGMTEPHEGFKVFAFDDRAGHLWRIALHQGSSGAGRVCARFHEVQVLIVDSKTWDVLANIGFLGDFGRAEGNQGQKLTPTACPTQAQDALADGSSGVRQIKVHSSPNSPVYAPWRLDDRRLIIPIALPNLTVWEGNSITGCKDMICDEVVTNLNTYGQPNDGTERFFQYYPGTGIEAGLSGEFYTDPLGRTILDASDPHAVRQYVKPGAAFALPQPYGKCVQWGVAAIYKCGGYSQGWPWANYSGAVGAPN